MAVYEDNHTQCSGSNYCDMEAAKTSQSCDSEAEEDDSCARKKRQSDAYQVGLHTDRILSNSMLRFDANNKPIHPQEILQLEQKRLHQFMRTYVEDYVKYLAVTQSVKEESNL